MRLLLLLIVSFFVGQGQAQELYKMNSGAQSGISSFENLNGAKGSGGKTNKTAKGNAFESLKANQKKVLLDVKGAGIIQRMWYTINDRSEKMLRTIRLQMFWDNANLPAVDVPFGDFFGVGLGKTVAFQSALFSNPEGRSFNCYIPMPFKTAAKVVIYNEGNVDLPLLFFDIDYIKLDKPAADMLYFHAFWNRKITSPMEEDYEFLPKVNGKGRFIGVNVGVNADSAYEDTWWGEGEVKFYLDGDSKYPSMNGTGTEDYIGTGWGQGVYTHMYQGCTIADEKNKKYTFYRFHLPDQIFFQKDIRVTIQKIGGGDMELVRKLDRKGIPLKPVSVANETGFIRLFEQDPPLSLQQNNFPKGWVNFYRVDDYSSTAYFYLDKPSSNLPPIQPLEYRIR